MLLSDDLVKLIKTEQKNTAAKKENKDDESVKLSGHQLFKLGLNEEHDVSRCPECSQKPKTSESKKFFVVRNPDGSFFLYAPGNNNLHARTDNVLQASSFSDKIFDKLENKDFRTQVFEKGSEVVEVRMSYVLRKVRDI